MLTETSLMTYSITMQLGVESPDWWGQLHHLRGASGWGTASKVKRCSSSFILVISHEMSWMWWKLPIDAIDHSWHHEPAKCFGRYCVYPEYFVGKSSQKHPNFQGSEEQWDHYDLPRARGYLTYLHPRMDANFLPFRRFPSIGRLFPDVLEMGIFGHTWPFQIPSGSFLLWAPLKPFWLWLGFGEPTLLGMVRPPPCFAVHVVLSVLVHPKFHFSFSKAFLLLNLWMEKKHEAGKSVSRM